MHFEYVWVDGEKEADGEGFSDGLDGAHFPIEDHDFSHMLDPEGEEVRELGHVGGTHPTGFRKAAFHGLESLVVVHEYLERGKGKGQKVADEVKGRIFKE